MGLLIALFWIVCGTSSAVVAGSKGHQTITWFIGGLLLGPIALIASTGLPDLELRRLLRQSTRYEENRWTPPQPVRSESNSRIGFFSEEEWEEILKLVRESGSDPALTSIERSYLTSSDTAIVCDKNRSQVIEIVKNKLGQWNIKT
jgi:hypothetical protein